MDQNPDFRELTRVLYAIVSAAPGQRDWSRMKALFHPDARMVRTGLDADGSAFAKVMSVDEYIGNAESLLGDVRFSEVELWHEAIVFGNVARLTSVYEFTWASASERRQGRGVNFFTLVRDRGGWRIMSIVWDNERPGVSLVEAGLPVGDRVR